MYSLPALLIEDRHIFDPAIIDIKINHLGFLKALEIAGVQALAVRGGHCPPLGWGSICLPYTNLEAATWWNVELANSKVFTVGVPSITLERVFNTSGYAVRS